MKQASSRTILVRILLFFTSVSVFLLFFISICSFKVLHVTEDFFKQLGISKSSVDEKITAGFLGGGFDKYGVRNAKNIALGNRKAVAIDLLTYCKKYTGSLAFIKQYQALRESHKPKETFAETPAQFMANNINRHKDFVAALENAVRKADAAMKPNFEKSLADARKKLAEAGDANHNQYMRYAKTYPLMVKNLKDLYQQQLLHWEKNFPVNHLHYIRQRLQNFLDVTKDVDFTAATIYRNGKNIFVKSEYERKGNQWKMAFRAGKEVVLPARDFVQHWVEEIR